MVRLQVRKTKSGNNYFSTIPKLLVEKLGWKPEDELLYIPDGDKIVIENVSKEKREV